MPRSTANQPVDIPHATQARLKPYVELRGADSGPISHVLALPALWVGLLYDPQSKAAALELIKGWTGSEIDELRHQVRNVSDAANIRVLTQQERRFTFGNATIRVTCDAYQPRLPSCAGAQAGAADVFPRQAAPARRPGSPRTGGGRPAAARPRRGAVPRAASGDSNQRRDSSSENADAFS